MTSDGSHVRIAGSYREQLVIEPVQHSDAGTYTCQSAPSAGNTQSTSFLFRVEGEGLFFFYNKEISSYSKTCD